jgi:hypothetical protein
MRVPRRVAVRLATLAAVIVTVVVVHTWRESDWPIDDRVRLGECVHYHVFVGAGMHTQCMLPQCDPSSDVMSWGPFRRRVPCAVAMNSFAHELRDRRPRNAMHACCCTACIHPS